MLYMLNFLLSLVNGLFFYICRDRSKAVSYVIRLYARWLFNHGCITEEDRELIKSRVNMCIMKTPYMYIGRNAKYRYTFIPVLEKRIGYDGRATPILTIPIYSSHLLILRDIFMKSEKYLVMSNDGEEYHEIVSVVVSL